MTGKTDSLTQSNDQRRRRRSLVLALTLAGVAVLFYVLTLVKMGPGLFERPF